MTLNPPHAGAGHMRFHVDGWDPSYGSSTEIAEADLIESTAKVDESVEVKPEDWAPVPPTPITEPGAILFVDGVRRIDARAWIEPRPAGGGVAAGAPDGTGERAGEASLALCASYAAGTVCCCGSGAHPLTVERRRGLFTVDANAGDVVTAMGDYHAVHTPDDPTQNIVALLSEALQRQLGELEIVSAANARSALAGHGVVPDSDLLVIDGPLRGRTHLPRAIGMIKSHRTAYLFPALHGMVARLGAGERTPVFSMGTNWDRYSWYLRLPCRPAAPWTGVVRVECAPDMPAASAVALANLSQGILPRFASTEYKDSRAPQNLVPIAGLERELRHRLGSPALLERALRAAAHTPAG